MTRRSTEAELGAGGPGDQADAAERQRESLDSVMGSQSGRPANQTADDQLARPQAKAGRAAEAAGEAPADAPARGVSQAERVAGPPDDRATTDWQHGEGEPPRR